jgi:ElaB/YqjD/DUF883 family membrane-anchored ribosome-binding protein
VNENMARIKKMKAKGMDAEMQQGLASMMNDINCMTIDCKVVKNSAVILDKFVEYRRCLRGVMLELLAIDRELATLSIMMPLLPELNQYLIGQYKRFNSLCLDKYSRALDILSLKEEDLIVLKNEFIRMQESDYLANTIKLYKNTSALRPNYKEFIANCADNGAMYLTEGLPIKASSQFATRAKVSIMVDNLCELWTEHDANDAIYNHLIALRQYGKDLHVNRQKPDIDISEMFAMLIKYMRTMRKDVPGCDNAFDIIERSSALFEKNYVQYYKSMVKTGSPMSIIEEFTSDVIANTNDAGGKELKQLRKMARHMKKLIARHMQSRNQKMPTHIKDMMDKMDSYFNEILTTESDDHYVNADEANEEFDALLA